MEGALEAVPPLMERHLKVLVGRGYDLEGVRTVPGQATADHLIMTFVNPKNGRGVEIAYYPPYKDMRRTFVVSFDVDDKRRFYLRDYLRPMIEQISSLG
jgi:hypothetical protein